MSGTAKFEQGDRVNHRHSLVKRGGVVLNVLYASGYIQYCVAFPECTAYYLEEDLVLAESEGGDGKAEGQS
jgi:hypothetical protein